MNRATFPVLSVVLGMLIAASPLEAGVSVKLVNTGVEPAASGTVKFTRIVTGYEVPRFGTPYAVVYASGSISCSGLTPNTSYDIRLGEFSSITVETDARGVLNATIGMQWYFWDTRWVPVRSVSGTVIVCRTGTETPVLGASFVLKV